MMSSCALKCHPSKAKKHNLVELFFCFMFLSRTTRDLVFVFALLCIKSFRRWEGILWCFFFFFLFCLFVFDPQNVSVIGHIWMKR